MNLKRQSFDYFYMFVMVIYMAQMSYATKTLFSISGDASIIGILIPNILTILLISRNKKKLKGNKRWLYIICSLVFFWIVAIAVKFGMVEARSGLYTIYYILIAYIQVRIFGQQLYLYYEDIMVKMAKLTLVMWLLGVILPPIDQLYTMFPLSSENDYRTMDGYNILYLFCWNHSPSEMFPRNAGFSWEPGRYAIMLALAIMVNLYRKGIRFTDNSNVWWLLVSLVSTRSTTGFSIVVVLYLYFGIKKLNIKYIVTTLLVLIPIIYAASKIEFLGAKVINQMEEVNSADTVVGQLQWNETNNTQFHVSLPRFLAIFFELQNIRHDPLTGYGPTVNNSYFAKNIATNATLTGGLLKTIGKYGIPLGLFFYFILFKSSVRTANVFGSKKKWCLFIYTLMSSISYDMFCVALFMSFWFYGVFDDVPSKEIKATKYHDRKLNSVITNYSPQLLYYGKSKQP